MGPGPSDVSPTVLNALARPTLGHLDPLFIQLMDETKQLLQYAFQTNNNLTMPISAPGSAGMEACVVNLVEPGDVVIVCQNGVFGGRMKDNVERCGGIAVDVTAPWGEPNTLASIEGVRSAALAKWETRPCPSPPTALLCKTRWRNFRSKLAATLPRKKCKPLASINGL